MSWVSNLFYQMYKDYGSFATYFKLDKAVVDYEAGTREDKRITRSIKVVLTPKMMQTDFIVKLLGQVEYNRTYFLTLKSEVIGLDYSTNDWIIHNQQRYGNLVITDLLDCLLISGEAVTDAPPYNVTEQKISDTLEISDANI